MGSIPTSGIQKRNRESVIVPGFCIIGLDAYITDWKKRPGHQIFMKRFIGSLLITMIFGIAIGVYLGWVQFPAEHNQSAMCQLSQDFREEYTLMVARGFKADGDRDSALRRLLPLRAEKSQDCMRDTASQQVDNVPAWVQEVTERYLSRGAELADICDLASLSAAFGRQIPNYADRPGTVCDQVQ